MIIMRHKKEKEKSHTVKAPVYRGYGGTLANRFSGLEQTTNKNIHEVRREAPPPKVMPIASPYGKIVYRRRVIK